MLIFIVNPTAGGGYAGQVAEMVRKTLTERGIAFEIWQTSMERDAAQLAVKASVLPECTGIISIGGDGTTFEMVSELKGCTVPIGVIPAGTGNDFIKTIGVPKKPMAALEFILSHEPRPIDVGCLNGKCFLNVCGVGFDVTVLEKMTAFKKRMRGIWPYLFGLIRAITCFEPVHVRYLVDGTWHEGDVLILAVANGKFIGGGIPVSPDSQPDDGMFDVILVQTVPRWKIPFYLPGLMLGKINRFSITTHIRCEEIKVISPGMRMQADGEIMSLDQAEFSIDSGHMKFFW